MKKTFLLLLILTPFFQGNAQVALGIRAGINYANLIDNTKSENPGIPVINESYKIAYHFGLTTKYSLSKRISLSTELLLSNKGYKNGSDRLHLLYINLPLLVNFQIIEKLSIHLGPETGFRLAATGKGPNYSADASAYFNNTFDLGLSAGINFKLTEKFLMTGRFTRGFLTIVDGIYYTTNGMDRNDVDSKVFNNCFQLSLTYLLLNN